MVHSEEKPHRPKSSPPHFMAGRKKGRSIRGVTYPFFRSGNPIELFGGPPKTTKKNLGASLGAFLMFQDILKTSK
jgi:hypothetical protein